MKIHNALSLAVMAAVVLFSHTSFSDEHGSACLGVPYGFEDADKDGVNDLFRDADGDGLDDVSGKPYLHAYPYADRDGDEKNDYFQDADGNGKNDLFKPGKHIKNYFLILFLDADNNGLNDVTGRRIPGYKLAKPFRNAADSIVEQEEKEKGTYTEKPRVDESRQQCR